MADERCFCHLNGLRVKDTVAREGMAEAIALATAAQNSAAAALGGIDAAVGGAAAALNRANEAAALAETTAEKIGKNVVTKPATYYVKASGSDENDGLSKDTAFKTMDKVFSMLNNGASELRFHILEPGVYDVNYKLFCFSALHILASVDGVVLNFTDDDWGDGVVFYNCHINFQGFTIKAPGNPIRFETSYCTFENMTIETDELRFLQSFVDCTTTMTVTNLFGYGALGRLTNLKITAETGHTIILDRGCNIRMCGTLTLPDRDTGNTDIAIACAHSVLHFQPATITGSGYKTGIKNSSSVVFLRQLTYTALSGVCETAILQETNYPGIFVKGGSIIGGDYE
jgi:hypothetical protein